MIHLPKQDIPQSQKDKGFISRTTDYYIDKAISANQSKDIIQDYYDAANGIMDISKYRYLLNPLNSDNPKLKNFPGDLRNHDIISPILRRYLGEFMRIPDRFMVTCQNSDVTSIKKMEIQKTAKELLTRMLQDKLSGAEEDDMNFEKHMNEMSESWEDERAKLGQEALNIIKANTDHLLNYAQAYFDWIVTGQVYSYRDVRNDDLHKEIISPLEAYPVTNNENFIEDCPEFTRCYKITYQQFNSFYKGLFDKESVKLIEDMYDRSSDGSGTLQSNLTQIRSSLGEAYYTFVKESNPQVEDDDSQLVFANNSELIDISHNVHTGRKQVKILSYIDEEGQVVQKDVPVDYELNRENGDIDVYTDYINEIVEVYRIGGIENTSQGLHIYSNLTPIIVQRDRMNNTNIRKLPYNGRVGLLKNWTNHSIIKTLIPFQVFINILYTQRERTIGSNVGKILIITKGLLTDDKDISLEQNLYYVRADKKLYVNEKAAHFATAIQGLKSVDASDHQYIASLGALISETKQEAWDTVDMNAQRYGDIATSAGKGTTEQAIARVSTGTVPINEIFYFFMEKDLQADIDYAKVAWRNGKKGSYINSTNRTIYFDIDGDEFMEAEVGIHVISDALESQRMELARELAHAAAQNQQFSLGVAALEADNTAELKSLVKKYEDSMKEHEMAKEEEKTKQVQAANEAGKEIEMVKTDLKKYEIDMDYRKAINVKLLDIQASGQQAAMQFIEGNEEAPVDTFQQNLDTRKMDIEADKNQVARETNSTNLKIAKENKSQ